MLLVAACDRVSTDGADEDGTPPTEDTTPQDGGRVTTEDPTTTDDTGPGDDAPADDTDDDTDDGDDDDTDDGDPADDDTDDGDRADDDPDEAAPVVPDPGVTAAVEGGFAILGDSNSDEYRADDDRGGAYASVTFNWMELLVKVRGLDFGEWGTWGGARRTGFEYNWARSGARSDDLVGQGQAAGVAQQVADGDVQYVYVHIGTNDFHLVNGTYREIYDGTLSDRQVSAKVAQVVRDITAAIDIVLAAEPERIVLTTFGDPGRTPRAPESYPSTDGRERVSRAIAAVNQGLVAMAASRPGVTLTDLDAFASSLLERVDADGNLDVGGELISIVEVGDEPHHVQLEGRHNHLGTVVSGLFANATFIGPFNDAAGLDIPMLTDDEILASAGL